MHNQSYKFNLLVGWCCLLSISVVIMVAIIAKESSQRIATSTEGETHPGDKAHSEKAIAGPEKSSVNYIHLVWAGNDKSPWTWTHSSSCFCPNTSLLLQNDSVIVTTGGFYHTYAQVTFINSKAHEGTVTLVANDNAPGKAVRKLSEAEQGGSTVSMSAVIRLRYGDSVKLNIAPESLTLRDASKTYWGLFLLAELND